MKINQPFNQLTFKEYLFYIDNHKKYTDFNTLGLYRSLMENEKLDLEHKIKVREYAHKFFRKSFDFLQLKDPKTYFDVSTLGMDLTEGDEYRLWQEIRENQEAILHDKKIRHRNFGVYSKHSCGYEHCPFNGVMFKQDSWHLFSHMHFKGDKNKDEIRAKYEKNKAHRRNDKLNIRRSLEEE